MSFASFTGGWHVAQNQNQPMQWIPCAQGNHPHNAIEAGYDFGARVLVARAQFNGALIPGKLHTGHRSCYVAWGGKEHAVPTYEVLVAAPGALRWVPSSGGTMVPNAVLGGHSETGEQLFVGRAHHAGIVTPGKVHPSHGVCYVPYGGKEVGFPTYDVLVHGRSA